MDRAKMGGSRGSLRSRPARKPRGFWNRPETIQTLQRYLDEEITLAQAMSALDCDEDDIRWYTRELRKGRLLAKESQRTEPISLQLERAIQDRLQRISRVLGRSIGETAALLLREKIREEEFPFVEFRTSPIGRQPFVKGSSLAIWEVALVGRRLDMDPGRTAAYLRWPEPKVQSAFAYAEAFRDEIEPFVEEAANTTLQDLQRKIPWIREARG